MISFEEDKKATYRESLKTLWAGTRQLACCLAATFSVTLLDSVQYAIKHFLVALMLLGVFVTMFVTMCNARAERDHANIEAYHLEQSCDSLRLIIGK